MGLLERADLTEPEWERGMVGGLLGVACCVVCVVCRVVVPFPQIF